MKKYYKPAILIDLDGVLNKYCGGYDENVLPKINENAINFLEKLYSLNKYNLILFTTRNLLTISYLFLSISEQTSNMPELHDHLPSPEP